MLDGLAVEMTNRESSRSSRLGIDVGDGCVIVHVTLAHTSCHLCTKLPKCKRSLTLVKGNLPLYQETRTCAYILVMQRDRMLYDHFYTFGFG